MKTSFVRHSVVPLLLAIIVSGCASDAKIKLVDSVTDVALTGVTVQVWYRSTNYFSNTQGAFPPRTSDPDGTVTVRDAFDDFMAYDILVRCPGYQPAVVSTRGNTGEAGVLSPADLAHSIPVLGIVTGKNLGAVRASKGFILVPLLKQSTSTTARASTIPATQQ